MKGETDFKTDKESDNTQKDKMNGKADRMACCLAVRTEQLSGSLYTQGL